jgi:hypothetical protein
VDPVDAALRVLQDAPGEELHWTVAWDRALKAGYIDPFTQPDARDGFMRALVQAARDGSIEKTSTGTYRCRV